MNWHSVHRARMLAPSLTTRPSPADADTADFDLCEGGNGMQHMHAAHALALPAVGCPHGVQFWGHVQEALFIHSCPTSLLHVHTYFVQRARLLIWLSKMMARPRMS